MSKWTSKTRISSHCVRPHRANIFGHIPIRWESGESGQLRSPLDTHGAGTPKSHISTGISAKTAHQPITLTQLSLWPLPLTRTAPKGQARPGPYITASQRRRRVLVHCWSRGSRREQGLGGTRKVDELAKLGESKK
jgi:hypothetical protein